MRLFWPSTNFELGNDEDGKRRPMPIVRQLVKKLVIDQTPGHQPATLEVHGPIASILAQMDVLTFMERRPLPRRKRG
jgi:site-specific DNA recombinase